jgi:hypothetical protein
MVMMKYRTIDGWFLTPEEAVADVVENQLSRHLPGNGVIPVCSKTIVANIETYGMQFWTPEEIAKGEIVNTDKTISYYITQKSEDDSNK